MKIQNILIPLLLLSTVACQETGEPTEVDEVTASLLQTTSLSEADAHEFAGAISAFNPEVLSDEFAMPEFHEQAPDLVAAAGSCSNTSSVVGPVTYRGQTYHYIRSYGERTACQQLCVDTGDALFPDKSTYLRTGRDPRFVCFFR